MKKIYALAALFAAFSMVACGGEQKKAEENAEEAAQTEVVAEDACCEGECAEKACCEGECAEKACCEGEACCAEEQTVAEQVTEVVEEVAAEAIQNL